MNELDDLLSQAIKERIQASPDAPGLDFVERRSAARRRSRRIVAVTASIALIAGGVFAASVWDGTKTRNVDTAAGEVLEAETDTGSAGLEFGLEDEACKEQFERVGPLEVGGRNLPVVVVRLADLELDPEMTQIWRTDAEMLNGVIPDRERQFLELKTARSSTDWKEVQGSTAALAGSPVILDERTVEKALAQGETEVLAYVYFLGKRNVADVVVSTDGKSYYSFCGAEIYGDSVTRTVATDPANAARAMALASLEPSFDEEPTEAELEAEMIDAWRAANSGERTFSDVLPPEVKARLVPIEVAFDLPESWVRGDTTLCLRTRVAWVA